MGKMLDSLVRTMPTPRPRVPASKPLRPSACTDSAETVVEPMTPFIEVGAPGRHIEASPDVLAVPVPRIGVELAPAAPRPIPAKLNKMPIATPALVEPRPHIMLESWPAQSSSQVPADVITFHQPDHPATQEYARLLTRMQADGANAHCVLLCGLSPESDAALLALNLAFQAARNPELQIAVIDAGTSSVLSELTNKGMGLHDVLTGKAALADAMCPTPCDNLQLIDLHPDAKLSPEALQWAFCWLRQRFQWISVVGPTADVVCPSIIRQCDELYLVAAPNFANDIAPLADRLIAQGAKIAGVIKWTLPSFA